MGAEGQVPHRAPVNTLGRAPHYVWAGVLSSGSPLVSADTPWLEKSASYVASSDTVGVGLYFLMLGISILNILCK